ncbi:DELLA protein RGL1-like [Salvia miltiorrhiza]|uniref:DELLA protein RGL1-like n=1 Tax=Salvia miltiorrhiza TaxID=226208 RepID=UPI0025AC46D3|nr:DELLA protein RGL1-like [Salvia miltiorrhiza]
MADKNNLEITAPNLQASFALLSKYRNQTKRLRNGKEEEDEPSQPRRLQMAEALSAVTIVKMALLYHSTSLNTGDSSNLAKSVGISNESENHLKHVLRLLDAAEKLSNQEYDEAEELLLSVLSSGPLPIDRLITCYAGYLRERIDVKKRRIDLEREVNHFDLEEAMIDLKAAMFGCEQKFPLLQISNYAAIQTILDSLASAEKIHLIDIGRKLCSYWIVMMHALANRKNCQLKQLKITAVCTPMYDVTGRGELLSSIAESMNLPFVFKMLYEEEKVLEKVGLECEAGEKVAVYMDHSLHCLSACPKNVEGLLRGLKRLNPHVMVVIDVEESFPTATFSQRFRGALCISSAVVDCIERCVQGDRRYTEIIEKVHFEETICNGVMSEDAGGESFSHRRRIDFWREYFARFGIMEREMSEGAICQARVMMGERPCWSSCSLSINGKSIILCWKGIPLRFVSAWNFHQDNTVS